MPLENNNAIENAYANFLQRYPDYASTSLLDELRQSDYSRLEALDQVYLDYTGGSLYAESQVRQHMQLLNTHVFGNPHSHNPTSQAMTALVERARAFVLRYFNASPEEYTAIFTANASGALKLVGESYPFGPGSRYVLTFDNHNSVNGIREFARAKGAEVEYIPVVAPELRLDRQTLEAALERLDPARPNLFAYPAQSNFSGVQHPLAYIDFARQRGWDVLLDCAAFAPTNALDISALQPDFAVFSFYKIFGFPTGLGCLLVRKNKLARLRRPWFAGGTITIASVQGNGHYLLDNEAAFEDGTVDYLNIPAVEAGLRYVQQVGIETIHTRVMCLAGWLLEQLSALQHANGRRMMQIYGPQTTEQRGATITISLLDVDGAVIDDHRVEELANTANISLRTGCFCNPGAGEIAHELTAGEMVTFFEAGERISFQELRRRMQANFSKSVSAVRISLGIASNFSDVYRLVQFLRGFLDRTTAEIGIATYDRVDEFAKRDSA
ncbi:MAG: aminotransferase class V-fold PLP-dependent enzyme [Chloroflexota bacterium]